jgi:hypothetical protein
MWRVPPPPAKLDPAWLAAIGTIAASVIALFGPALRSWWSNPRLNLTREEEDITAGDELVFVGDERSEVHVVPLVVSNYGRTQADDVEAILTAEQRFGPDETDGGEPIPDFLVPNVSRAALRFELADPTHTRITVPRGFSRRLQFVLLGSADRVSDRLKDWGEAPPPDGHASHGAFCAWPAEGLERALWLSDDEPVHVTITITARNAKARTWTGGVRVRSWTAADEPGLSGVELQWIEPLRRRRRGQVRGPLRRRATALSPRRLWSNYRLKRELKKGH